MTRTFTNAEKKIMLEALEGTYKKYSKILDEAGKNYNEATDEGIKAMYKKRTNQYTDMLKSINELMDEFLG